MAVAALVIVALVTATAAAVTATVAAMATVTVAAATAAVVTVAVVMAAARAVAAVVLVDWAPRPTAPPGGDLHAGASCVTRACRQLGIAVACVYMCVMHPEWS